MVVVANKIVEENVEFDATRNRIKETELTPENKEVIEWTKETQVRQRQQHIEKKRKTVQTSKT